jgi:hypothetical protein
MNWVRRIFVYLLSVILLVSLFGIALATSIQVGLSHPNKVEGWLEQSHLYTNLVSTITDQAQTAIENNVSGGAAISSTVVRQAAQSAFPQSLLKQSVQTFVNSNYAWLEGKTATPTFKIDLSNAKQQFATKVAESSVVAHLKSLPACTPAQTVQLASANPLLLSCSPVGISSQVVAAQLSQQVAASSGFLNSPVITASSISTKGLNTSKPYYQKLTKLPKAYQLIQKLPWILSIVGILSVIGIVFCSRSKRSGIRKVSIVLFISGIILVIDKLITDALFSKFKSSAFNGVNNSQIQQSLTSFAHYVEAELVKIDLWFGIAYLALAIILFGLLIATRQRTKKPKKPSAGTPVDQAKIQHNANDAPLADRLQRQPYIDSLSPTNKTRKGPRPPRLIQ